MPVALRPCQDCGSNKTRGRRCWSCEAKNRGSSTERFSTVVPVVGYEPQAMPQEVLAMEGRRVCRTCLGWTQEESGRHKKCEGKPNWTPPGPDASRRAKDMDVPTAPPFKQAVWDLETYCLDRSWGVLLMGTILVHGDGGPKMYTFSHRDSESFKAGKRGDDAEVFAQIYYTLEPCAITYAHSGRWFDMRWINALSLKYGFAPLNRKLVDPVQLAKNKFALGNNSLASQLDFIDAQEQKMPLGESVWRDALMNDDDSAWEKLRARNRSDVIALNELAIRVAPFVGLIDFSGSAWR